MNLFCNLILLNSLFLGVNQVDYVVTPNSVGDIKLGDSIGGFFDKFPENSIRSVPAWKYGIDGSDEGHLVVINQSDTLMFIWSKDDDKTIGGIVCLSSVYRTEDGLGVDSTIGEIEKLHPYIFLRPSYLNSSVEYVSAKYEGGFIHFENISNNGIQIGTYDSDTNYEPETKKYKRHEEIDRLVIWH